MSILPKVFYGFSAILVKITIALVQKGEANPHGSDGRESACNVGDLGQSLGWEGPLEKKMAIHSSILAWRIPMDGGAWQATVIQSQRAGHD